MNPETREALIDAGVLRPGSLDDAHLTLLRVPPDRAVLRIDDVGRAVAARDIRRRYEEPSPTISDDLIARWRRGRRAA